MEKLSITKIIETKIFELLENNPDGMRWVDLNNKILESNSTLHPKTVNGIIWKIVEKYPEKIYKPSKGIFKLKK